MPVTIKRIVCLANSRKPDGRCVAGKELNGTSVGAWIRPVSARSGGEVSEHERHYENGSDPQVLDVIDVPLLKSVPKGHQKENWLLDPNSYWVKTSRLNASGLAPFIDNPKTLWVNGHSKFNGMNDFIPEDEAKLLPSSLFLIQVKSLELKVFAPGVKFNNPKRRVQGQFQHNGVDYWLWVTDPQIERPYLAKNDGTYTVGPCFLTISLGEPFNNECFKLIATVVK